MGGSLKTDDMRHLCECECGCGKEVAQEGNRFIKGHQNRGKKNPNKGKKLKPYSKRILKSQLCECGCGKVTKEGNRYLIGHNGRGKTHSEETKLKMRGRKSWNKGKIGVYSKETYAKMRVSSTYNLKDWEEKCPLLSKMEDMKEEDGKILTHCTNHNCPNSKEKGGWFILKREQISNRMFELNNGKDNGCFYCSESCKETCIKFHKSAVQLQNEIEIASGIHEEPLYTSEEYNTWKKEVFRRYKEEFGCIECEYCGNRNISELSVHHEKPQKTHPHLALDPDNGIIACNQFSEKKCHYKYGHKTGTECSTGNLANKICSEPIPFLGQEKPIQKT